MRSTEHLRFTPLEGGRALLAWWVVSSHLIQRGAFEKGEVAWPLSSLQDGTDAVQIFMILSGFVITHLITSRRESYPVYIGRRFLRIFPAYFAIVFGFLVINAFIGAKSIAADVLPWHLLTHLFMLHGVVPNEILPDASTALLGPAWSISLEWQFYLVAPIIVWAVFRQPWWLVAVLGIIVLLWTSRGLGWGEVRYTWGHDAFLPRSLHYFLLGIGSYFVIRFLPALKLPWVLVIALGAWLLTRNQVICGWILLLSSVKCDVLSAALSIKPLQWLGTRSFSTYLVHMPVIAVLERTLLVPYFGVRGWTFFWTLTALTAVIVPMMSYLIYRFIEKPAMDFGRTLGAPRPGSVAATRPAE